MISIENEIKLAKEKAEDEYSKSIYECVEKMYAAVKPIIDDAGHSGFSYFATINKFFRVLSHKPLTPITEQDFYEIEDYTNEDGVKVYQGTRFSNVFKKVKPDGNVLYSDVDRIVIVDQYGMTWHSGFTEQMCKDLIPPIKMPYMPTDNPIKIYAWQFSYSKDKGIYKEIGSYNAEYIQRIVFPNGEIKQVDRLYIDDVLTEGFDIKKLGEFIKKDVEDWKNG